MKSERKFRAAIVCALLIASALLAGELGRNDTDAASHDARGIRIAARHTNADAAPPPVPYDAATARVSFVATQTWEHDTSAFTEGLLIHDGRLIESTGLEGHSDVREIERTTGVVRRRGELANGIAFDAQRDRVLVTGKMWPKLFEMDRSAFSRP